MTRQERRPARELDRPESLIKAFYPSLTRRQIRSLLDHASCVRLLSGARLSDLLAR